MPFYQYKAASTFIFHLDCIFIHNTVNIAIVYRLFKTVQRKERKKSLIGHCVRSYSDQQPQKNGQCMRKCDALISFTVFFFFLLELLLLQLFVLEDSRLLLLDGK